MIKLRTALLAAAALGATALGSQVANANFYVFYSTDGGSNYTAVNPGGNSDGLTIGSFNFTTGNIQIGTSSFSNNAPDTGGSSGFVTNSQLVASNTGASSASIRFAIVDNGFQGPTGGGLVNSITLINNTAVSGTTLAQLACVNNNATVPTTGNVSTLCNGSPNASTTPTLTTPGASGSQSTSVTTSVGTLNTPFTIAEFFTLTLAGGANVNGQGTATLSSVPEPVSLSLLAMGLMGLGAAGMRRKF